MSRYKDDEKVVSAVIKLDSESNLYVVSNSDDGHEIGRGEDPEELSKLAWSKGCRVVKHDYDMSKTPAHNKGW
jgi:hypothetical protein